MYSELISGLPLIAIFLHSLVVLMFDAYSAENKKPVYIATLVGLVITLAAAAYAMTLPPQVINSINPDTSFTRGSVSFEPYAAFFDMIFIVAGILTIISARPYLQKENFEFGQFYSVLVFAVCGMMIIAHSAHLLTLFVGIELMSISFYILAGYFRNQLKSVEAALKYFLLGAFATGFLVYGMAMIYGSTGNMYFSEISRVISSGNADSIYLTIGMALLIIGMCFKVAAFPFHQWAPDVYTGSPTVVTAFMSTAGKAAALIGFIIIAKNIFITNAYESVTAITERGIEIIAYISAATMLIGNISALVQKNIKRMLAYSSVAHAGYLLMGIVANSEQGWKGILFYSTAYLFMQLGAFIILASIEKNTDRNLDLEDYSGLSNTQPALAAYMSIFMFSLAGIPPFAGFFGKYILFAAAIDAGFTWLTIVAVISSMISVYFYIGLVVYMYFREGQTTVIIPEKKGMGFSVVISVICVLLFGIFPSIIMDIADKLF